MRIASIVVVALVGAVASGFTQSASSASDLADLVATELQAARVPGAAIAVVVGDERVARGIGMANAETQAPFDAHTGVHIGSLTKLFTALAVVGALENRKLPMDTAVGGYVSGLAPRAAAATFHHLLSNASGIRDRSGDVGTDAEVELGNQARELKDGDFLFPAGALFSYSNLGYALAGAALEGLVKRPYAEVMRTDLFARLGMTRSTLRLRVATAASHAVGHKLELDVLKTAGPPANDTRILPAGYMWTSASDMSHALFALLHEGRIDGKQAIPASVVAQVMAPHTAMPNIFVDGHYGYGLMIAHDRGVAMYEHGGTMPGFSSILRFAPQRRIGVAILTNLNDAPLRRIASRVMANALSLPIHSPPARDAAPVTPREMESFLGSYRNNRDLLLSANRDMVLLSFGGAPPLQVFRVGPNRFEARPSAKIAGTEFVLAPARGDMPAYLHHALWGYVRHP